MKESEIAAYILQHDARNLQLRRRLAERGLDWREQFQTTCRFRAPGRRAATLLAAELYKKGFILVVRLSGTGKNTPWQVRARRCQSIDTSASHEFTEQMVRTAAAFSCSYEGWDAALVQHG